MVVTIQAPFSVKPSNAVLSGNPNIFWLSNVDKNSCTVYLADNGMIYIDSPTFTNYPGATVAIGITYTYD